MTHRQPTVNPIPHWSERHGWRSLGAFTGVLALSFIFAPILWLVVMSFSEDPLSGFPGPFTITYYRELLDQTGWVAPLLKSLGIAAAVSVVSMVASTLIGRAIPRIRRGKVALTGIVLLPMMIPGRRHRHRPFPLLSRRARRKTGPLVTVPRAPDLGPPL